MSLFTPDPKAKMLEIISALEEASDKYYNDREIMSDYEYDKLLDELQQLEKSTGTILDNSPTKRIGAPVKVDKLGKVVHAFPAKSLDKTKDVDVFINTFNVFHDSRDEVVLMWKLDGCTIQLTYDNGELISAATRGDGYIGQDITHNAKAISGIPLKVPDKGRFIVRGEALISYSDFEAINSTLPDEQKYKNPRNLASASITMLNSEEVKQRKVCFKMFELVAHQDVDIDDEESNWSFIQRLRFGKFQGFDVVPAKCISAHPNSLVELKSGETLEDIIYSPKFDPKLYEYPVDGLVCVFNDTLYTRDLVGSEHHPHKLKGYALKWPDELKETTIRNIEWSPSRTGLLTPVAVFDPVDIDGTTVSRASLHNFSIMRKLNIRIGDTVNVYKANMIIPQIANNVSDNVPYSEQDLEMIGKCPACGSQGVLEISEGGVESVHCKNKSCSAKLINKLVHFCSRSAMNIEGLSESTLSTFVNLGYITEFADIYKLIEHKDDIIELDSFGQKSWDNLWAAIQASRSTTFTKVVVGLGVDGVGISQAKVLAEYFNHDLKKFLESTALDFSKLKGVGETLNHSIKTWLADEIAQTQVDNLLKYLDFNVPNEVCTNKLTGLTFVITGKLNEYTNRKELEAEIEHNGGKIASSVSKNTSYLINNDLNSNSSKNKKAKELNVKIITETEYQSLIAL